MDITTCPFCHLRVLSVELERHANSHFDDEDVVNDFELGRDVALAPSSSPQVSSATLRKTGAWERPESSSSSSRMDGRASEGRDLGERISCLVNLQMKGSFYHVEGGMINMLRSCLELEPENCMLSSHLLKQRQEARNVLFGGSGFVPDIPSLQRWLEIAWEQGFDMAGSKDFDQEIYGKRNWIGTTECATLFRSFGLRARIVDFCSKTIAPKVYGPMDKYVSKWKNNVSDPVSFTHDANVKGQEVLIDWVWNYFSDPKCTRSDNRHVLVSLKAPLYFQHQGHSRTIVGIQKKLQKNGSKQYNLLILDPGHRTKDLAKSLRDNDGWQRLIKRGVHTLRKPLYQLCFIDHGVAFGEEVEKLKNLQSIRHEF
nr:zinc finger with UFM1-specific peptidase domain protein [Ipomoea batatas]